MSEENKQSQTESVVAVGSKDWLGGIRVEASGSHRHPYGEAVQSGSLNACATCLAIKCQLLQTTLEAIHHELALAGFGPRKSPTDAIKELRSEADAS